MANHSFCSQKVCFIVLVTVEGESGCRGVTWDLIRDLFFQSHRTDVVLPGKKKAQWLIR